MVMQIIEMRVAFQKLWGGEESRYFGHAIFAVVFAPFGEIV
jgi:hypothetical protein